MEARSHGKSNQDNSANEWEGDPLEDNPHLCNTIERNIRTLTSLRHREARHRGMQERIADGITDFSGRMIFVYIHVVIFGVWILINLPYPHHKPIDPFPFNFLTMVVSLEAIFLSTFVLISQNRMSAQADKRAELDLHIGLITEYEITRILRMLDSIQDKLGIENDADTELSELERTIHPTDVLKEIDRIEQRSRENDTRLKKKQQERTGF